MADSEVLKVCIRDSMWTSILFLIVGIVFASSTTSTKAAETAPEVDARAAVVAYFLGGDEPTVEAASWSSEKQLNVGVHYMGSQENNFARYVCSVLRKRGLDAGARVSVVDINTMSLDGKQWEVVGEAACKE